MNLRSYLFPIFILAVFVSLSALGSSATCNGTGNVINLTTISDGCTLNTPGTYNFATGTYQLNGSGLGAIVISANNILLNGNGSIIIGNSTDELKGIRSPSNLIENVTIKDFNIRNFHYNIILSNANNFTIINNNLSNTVRGITIQNSNFININNTNILNYTLYGVVLINGSNNNINENFFNATTTNSLSIYHTRSGIGYSNNNTILNNIFFGNNRGLRALNSDANSTNIIFRNNTILSFNSSSILIDRASYSLIENNNITSNNGVGIHFRTFADGLQVGNHTVRNNNIYNSSSYCILFEYDKGSDYAYNNNLTKCDVGVGFVGSNSSIAYNNNIEGSKVTGTTNVGYRVYHTNNVNLWNSTLSNLDRGVEIRNVTFSSVRGVNVNNATFSNDDYNVGIQLMANEHITLDNNLINRSSNAILIMNSTNITVSNNNLINVQTGYSFFDHYDAKACIFIAELYETYLGFGLESGGSNITYISGFKSNNITISNNTYDCNVYLRNQGGVGVVHDLINYWFKSHQFPTYLLDRDDYYISNSYNNISVVNQSGQLDLVTTNGFNNNLLYYYQTTRDYSSYRSKNETLKQVNLYNLTNALIYNNTYAQICSNNCNKTLTFNEQVYVLDNFNITEGVTRQFSPISVSGSSTQKTITSSLSQSVNATVIVNVAQCSFSANYNGGLVNEDSCNDNIATFTLNEIPAGNSVLSFTYLDINCSTNTGASVIIILVFCALAIVALTFILVMKFREGEFDVKILIIVFIAIVVGLVLFTQVAQLTGGVCS